MGGHPKRAFVKNRPPAAVANMTNTHDASIWGTDGTGGMRNSISPNIPQAPGKIMNGTARIGRSFSAVITLGFSETFASRAECGLLRCHKSTKTPRTTAYLWLLHRIFQAMRTPERQRKVPSPSKRIHSG